MNLNLVVIAGRLTVAPDATAGPTGVTRILMTVRSGTPGRIDLLPVVAPHNALPAELDPGATLWVAGSLHRRFSPETGKSRLEIVAGHIEEKIN